MKKVRRFSNEVGAKLKQCLRAQREDQSQGFTVQSPVHSPVHSLEEQRGAKKDQPKDNQDQFTPDEIVCKIEKIPSTSPSISPSSRTSPLNGTFDMGDGKKSFNYSSDINIFLQTNQRTKKIRMNRKRTKKNRTKKNRKKKNRKKKNRKRIKKNRVYFPDHIFRPDHLRPSLYRPCKKNPKNI